MYVCKYVCMYACMYVCMYSCMHVCMYVCTYVRTYVCMNAYLKPSPLAVVSISSFLVSPLAPAPILLIADQLSLCKSTALFPCFYLYCRSPPIQSITPLFFLFPWCCSLWSSIPTLLWKLARFSSLALSMNHGKNPNIGRRKPVSNSFELLCLLCFWFHCEPDSHKKSAGQDRKLRAKVLSCHQRRGTQLLEHAR